MEKSLNEEMLDSRTFLSEYYGRENDRTAVIYTRPHGLEVEFLAGGKVVDSRMLTNHNRNYAEDACENWVEGIIK